MVFTSRMDQSSEQLRSPSPRHDPALPPLQLQHDDLVNLLARRWQHARHQGILFIRLYILNDRPISTDKRRS